MQFDYQGQLYDLKIIGDAALKEGMGVIPANSPVEIISVSKFRGNDDFDVVCHAFPNNSMAQRPMVITVPISGLNVQIESRLKHVLSLYFLNS